MLTQIIEQSVNKKSNLLKCFIHTQTHMKCRHYISLNKIQINNVTKLWRGLYQCLQVIFKHANDAGVILMLLYFIVIFVIFLFLQILMNVKITMAVVRDSVEMNLDHSHASVQLMKYFILTKDPVFVSNNG